MGTGGIRGSHRYRLIAVYSSARYPGDETLNRETQGLLRQRCTCEAGALAAMSRALHLLAAEVDPEVIVQRPRGTGASTSGPTRTPRPPAACLPLMKRVSGPVSSGSCAQHS